MYTSRHHNIFRTIYFFLLVNILLFVVPLTASAADGTGEIFDGITGFVYNISIGIGGIALWFGGMLLDLAVYNLVVNMGEHMSGSIGVAVDTLWVVVRDGFNVLFIFGVIYIGFRVILFSEDSKVKTTLGWLIVAALMVNFSLFVTKAIVDFTNVTALQIYNATISDKLLENRGVFSTAIYQTQSTAGSISYETRGISASFMNLFHMTSYTNQKVLEDASEENNIYGGRIMFYGILMMFVMLIAAFVFAAGAFLMISRFIALIIFMIFSPVMFVGMVFPYLQKYQKMWWGKFLQYAFVGPAYLFMIYISLFVLNSIGVQNNTFADAFTNGKHLEGSFVIFLNFFVIAGFLVAALYIAQQMGAYGADASMGMLKSTGNYIRGGVQSYVGRNSVGRISGGLQKANDSLQTTTRGRAFKRALSVGTLGMLDERTRQGLTEKGLNAKFGGSYSRADDKKWGSTIRNNDSDGINKGSKERHREKLKNANAAAIEKQHEDIKNKSLAVLTNKDAELEDFNTAVKDLGKAIKDMSTGERAGLGESLKTEAIAMHLTNDDISAMVKEGYITSKDGDKIKEARKNAFNNIAYHGTFNTKGTSKLEADTPLDNAHPLATNDETRKEHQSNMREFLAKRGTKAVGELDVDIFKQKAMYEVLTPSMIEERLRNGGVSKADLKKMLEAFKEFHSRETDPGFPGLKSYTGIPENSSWSKWKNSNSTFAAQFYTADDN